MKNNSLSIAAALLAVMTQTVLPWHIAAAEPADSSDLQAIKPNWLDVPRPSELDNAQPMPELPSHTVSFETTEGTWMSVDVSPDGKTLVFDLLGDIYQLPIEGGEAIPLTSGTAWDQVPRFSPDGTQIYFVSDREGSKDVWRFTLADQSIRPVTRSSTNILGGVNWSQDGSRLLAGVAAKNELGADIVLHSIDPVSGAMMPINPPIEPLYSPDQLALLRERWKVFSGLESSDGKVYFSEIRRNVPWPNWEGETTRLFEFDRRSQTLSTMTEADSSHHEYKPQMSNDGNLLAYFRQYNEKLTELRILNRTSGQDNALVTLMNPEYPGYAQREDSRPNYAFTPDDKSVIFWHAGKIHRVELADGSKEIVPFRVVVNREVTTRTRAAVKRPDSSIGEAEAIRWPSFSSDGQILAFSAFGYVWVANMTSGNLRRLSNTDDFEYMPAISPDGSSVAYISFGRSGEEYGRGRLIVVDTDGGLPREVLADDDADFLMPKWSPDGSMIAVIRQADKRRVMSGAYGWTDVSSGIFHQVASPTGSGGKAYAWLYARSMGFNAEGDRLLFSYPRSPTETILAAADLDGGNAQTLAVGTSEVGGIAPSPDLKSLALTRRDGSVWVVPFDVGEGTTTVSSLKHDARKASRNGGYYVDWNTHERLTFGVGKDLYRYRSSSGKLQSFRVELQHPKDSTAQPIAFTGARLITMSDGAGPKSVIESGTIVVVGEHIAAAGPESKVEIPTDARVVDMTGKTIIPGFVDTHYHTMLASFNALALPEAPIADPTAIKFGITSAWNPGGQGNDGVPAIADLQRAGRIAGPRLSYALEGGVGNPYETLNSYAAALAAVSRHRELGVDVLKEYSVPTRQQQQWLSAAAHESGLGIVSHLDTFDGTMTRVVDGYTGGDHPSLPDSFYKDVVELLRQTGYIWTPNLVITSGITGTLYDKEHFFCAAISQGQPRLDSQVVDSACGFESEDPTVLSYDLLRVGRVAKSVALAVSKGVTIGVSGHNAPGSNLHREMWHLWKGGMPAEDVLKATINVNARKLGLQQEIGTLERGKMADFLVLDENPLEDMLNTLSIRYTVQGGVVYDSATAERLTPADLRRRLATQAAANDDEALLKATGTHE